MSAQVAGYCPMGCGQTLYLDDARIYCRSPQCSRGDAVSDLLADNETEHIVKFGKKTFTVRHPLRERLDDALMECVLHDYIRAMPGPPVTPGTYRARQSPDGWIFLNAAGPGTDGGDQA